MSGTVGQCRKVLQEVEKAVGRAAIDGAEIVDRTDRGRWSWRICERSGRRRCSELARQVLGEEIQDLKDPRIGFATVTAVRITPDLRQARVFVSVLGSEDERTRNDGGAQERQAPPAH